MAWTETAALEWRGRVRLVNGCPCGIGLWAVFQGAPVGLGGESQLRERDGDAGAATEMTFTTERCEAPHPCGATAEDSGAVRGVAEDKVAVLESLVPARVIGAGITFEANRGRAAASHDWMRTPGPLMSILFNPGILY